MDPKISLFGSAVRSWLWEPLLESLRTNKVSYEVVFCGFFEKSVFNEMLSKYPELKYIQSAEIKPAQCAEIARRACTGELIGWIDDDYIFSEGLLDKIWVIGSRMGADYILSIKTIQRDTNDNWKDHRFFARNYNTPIMAHVGFINREYLNNLGGIDIKYMAGCWEHDIVMRVLSREGRVITFENGHVIVDHENKLGIYNNYWCGYNQDHEQLEKSWVIGGYAPPENPIATFVQNQFQLYYPITNREVTLNRQDDFEGYEAKDILTKSQGANDRWQ